MSAPRGSDETGPAGRPQSVNLAVGLLVIVGVLAMVDAIVTIIYFRHAAHASDLAFSDTADGFINPGAFRLRMIVEIVLGIITAAGIVVLASLIRRGSRNSRVGIIIMSAIGLVCFGAAIWGNPGQFGYGGVPGDEVTIAAQQSAAGLPDWARLLMTGGAIASFVLLVAVIILVTRPSARAYAARPAPAVDPGVE